ncbi:Down syndrome cell adhesion molecule-like protein Dscam2 [Folsomia candida]|nr:Down syndrome cell adhesion molecule-like protein Dscam2 [Folsomia candida]
MLSQSGTSNFKMRKIVCAMLFLVRLDPILQAWSLSLDESGPRFLDEWSSSYVFSSRLGGRLRCGGHGSPQPRVEWVFRDGFPVGNVTGLREVLPTGNIRFLPFPIDKFRPDVHFATLRCKLSNPSGTIISPEVVVRAVLDTPFHIQNPDVAVIRGNNALLRCLVPPELVDYITVTSWVQDGSLNIYPNFQTGKWLLLPSGELHVFSVDESDGRKVLACRTLHKLTNEVMTSEGARIVVKEPEGPQAVRILGQRETNLRVRAGEETYLSCHAEGNPPPSFSWHREIDGVLSDLAPTSKRPPSSSPSSSPQNSVVHVAQVRPQDAGSYLCRANNSHSVDQAVVQLVVYVPLRVQVSPPTQIVDVGRSASLRCLVSGLPIHSLVWFKDGVPLAELESGPSSSPRFEVGPREVLKLVRVQPEDAGMYQCLASNDFTTGQDSSQIRLGSVLPEMVYRFSEQTIQPGPSVSLKCTAVGNPPPQFTWTLDGFALPESERFLVGQYVTIHDNVISHVNITHARDEDGGLYACQARNAMGIALHTGRLNIYGPPFVRPVPPIKGVAGKNLQIQCPVSGYPIESISWERGGSLLPVTRMQRVYPNGTLILEHLQKTDEGILTCHAKGRQGQISSRDIHLRVVVPPKLMPFQFMNTVLREGMRAAVSCQLLEGDRPIDLVWEFEGKTISGGVANGITIRVPDEYSSTLVIDSLSSVHNGKYTCIAENSAGREHYSSELTVQIPPKWILEPRDVNVSVGHSLSLQCRAEGHPTPAITWKRAIGMHPGDYKDILSPTGSSSPFANGTIRFDQVRKSDEGNYLCEARNDVGSGLSKVIFLKVNAPAKFNAEEQAANSVISVRFGEKAILGCRIGGDLPIQIEWGNKHGKIGPHSNHRYTFRQQELEDGILSELLIASVDRSDSGAYSCRASNPFGSDHTIVTLNVQEPPEQPGNLRVVEVGSHSVGISWLENFNGNSPLINFIIQSKFPSETWTEAEVEELAVPATQSTALVEGLTPSSTYHLRVLAQNGVGFSPPSEVVQITTTEEAPEGPPIEIVAEADSSTRLRVRWAPPERALWHGQILGYYLGYRELSLALADHPVLLSQEDGNEGVTMTGENWRTLLHSHLYGNLADLHGYHFKTVEVGQDFGGETTIHNLRKFTRYAIVVQAFNAKGAGPSSSPTVATTLQDVPTQPPEKFECRSTSPQSLVLTWEPPPLEARHGAVQGYKVDVLVVGGQDEGGPGSEAESGDQIETKVTTERDLVLHGLRKWTNYSVTVRGFTVVGDGAVSTPLLCRTDEDVPSPPLGLKAVVSSRRSILISWLPPANPNGKVLKFTVYSRISDETKVEKKQVSFPDLRLEWVGLKEASTYEFWVSCTTRVGEGTPTKRINATTPTNNKVSAKIATFSGTVEIPWKKELGLDCVVVGVPEPTVEWSFNGGAEIHGGNGKREVQPSPGGNTKLVVKDVGVEDGGNYTCTATNAHGSESVVYAVKVQTPPEAPILQVIEVGYTSLKVVWSTPHSGGSQVRGYLVSYRRDGGDWEETEVGPRATGHTLQPLLCGSTYQLYITAVNKIGPSPASDILTRSTKGSAPISPKKEEALVSNHSTIVMRLDLWKDAGCPILRFTIEYKKSQEKSWMRIPAELNGSAKSYTLTGLHANTRYDIRVTAGNHAGDTLAKYEFLTGSLPPLDTTSHGNGGGKSPGESIGESRDGDSALGENEASTLSTSLLIVFPSVLALAMVTAVISFFCYIRRKRILGIPHPKTVIGDHNYAGSGDGTSYLDCGGGQGQGYGHGQGGIMYDAATPHQHYTLVKGSQGQFPPDLTAQYATKGRDLAGDYGDDVCPYATFQLPENPPTRPLLTKGLGGSGGFHTGDTLYNVGNVYSGPYHAVQSQNSMATLSLRDTEYMKSGRLTKVVGDEEDAEVTKILAMHMPPLEYDDTGANDGEISPKYHHPHNQFSSHFHNDYASSQQQRQIILQQQQYQKQHVGTFRRRNGQDRIPTSEEMESSSSSLDEESSPTTGRPSAKGGRASYCAGRPHHHRHKSSKKSTSGSSNSGGGGQIILRVRSSSGYSSHTEETSFTTTAQPPPKLSDAEDQLLHRNDDASGAKGLSMKRNQGKQQRQSRSKNKGGFHIDV